MSRRRVLRLGFTVLELVVVLIVIALLLALFLPAVQPLRVQSRSNQCRNNLKQIALAIHNFHDVHNGLPPLALGDARRSMFVELMPYAEAQNVYNLFVGGNAGLNTSIEQTLDPGVATSAWHLLTDDERAAASCLKWMQCPSRRSGIQWIGKRGRVDRYAGPTGDYAVVFLDQSPTSAATRLIPDADSSAAAGWQRHQDPCDPEHVARQKGAIRLAEVNCDLPSHERDATRRPRDTFARLMNGTANTLLVGEKHVRNGELNRYSASQDDQDGVFFFTTNVGGRSYNVARNLALPLADGPNDPRFRRGQSPPRGPHADFGFGSWHGNYVPFVVADGSVRRIEVNIDEQVKRWLGCAEATAPMDLAAPFE